MTEIKNVPVKVAAKILGKSEMFVRCGLRAEKFKFGVAVTKKPDARRKIYSYHISPKLFMEYTGCTEQDILNLLNEL